MAGAVHRSLRPSPVRLPYAEAEVMAEHPDRAFAEAWECVLRARTASPPKLRALAARISAALERDPTCSAMILRLAVSHHLAYRLVALADAAPPGAPGVLYRLAAAAEAEQEARDDCWEEPELDDDYDELPA